MDGGACWAAVHGVAQSRTWPKRLSVHACIGEGNGNPLQCSCLENPRDRGACWAAIDGVAQSQTRLQWLSSSRLLSCLCDRVETLCRDCTAFKTWDTRFLFFYKKKSLSTLALDRELKKHSDSPCYQNFLPGKPLWRCEFLLFGKSVNHVVNTEKADRRHTAMLYCLRGRLISRPELGYRLLPHSGGEVESVSFPFESGVALGLTGTNRL